MDQIPQFLNPRLSREQGGCYPPDMDDPKPEARNLPECEEGEQAAGAFSALVKRAVSTSPATLKERDKRWRKERKRAKNKKITS